MHGVDGTRLDLNLLVVLDAILQRGSVTQAAAALGLTQPTVSHALGRLRAALADPLLVRSGRAMVRTPRAERLAPAVHHVLGEIDRALSSGSAFDPATSARVFTIACPDLLAVVLPSLLARLSREAPSTRIEARPVPPDLEARLGDRAIDLAVIHARDRGPGLSQRVLGRARWCIVARRGHAAISSGRLSRKAWLARPHVIVQTADGMGIVGRELARLGIERRVGFVAPSSLAALHAAAATDWFFAAPRELVEPSLAHLDLVAVAPPVPLPEVRVALVWHESMREDEGHRFLRELLGAVIRGALRPAADSARVS
ncbi:MAG: LysR family transcriptional regulator [Polyangiaceae bacterium]